MSGLGFCQDSFVTMSYKCLLLQILYFIILKYRRSFVFCKTVVLLSLILRVAQYNYEVS